jgi:tRNA dimethylallyltransferase
MHWFFAAKTAGVAKMAVERVEQPLLVIIGATASGKSELALRLADKFGAELLSVDSMQVYRGMDIGTAKPSAEQQQDVRHHLIDVAEPIESFSVARFVELADKAIAEAKSPLIATGGTPMYFKALFEGLFEGPGADESVRERLRSLSGAELHERLKRSDPAAAERIHPGDNKRLVRALEVYELTGKPISSLQKEWEQDRPPRHRAVWIGLSWERDELNRRINARVKEMISVGWVDEVRRLLTKYSALSKTAAEATGYAELIDHLSGGSSLDDAVEQIKIATRQLARRQMKWFRRFKDVHWLEGRDAIELKIDAASTLWKTAK